MPADVLDAHVRALGLAEAAARLAADPDGAPVARALRLAVLRAPLPEPLARALDGVVARDGSLAIRSSATVEGVRGASFAGQFASFLDVRDAAQAATAVRSCWASLWSPPALAYRRALAAATRPAMGVLVQRFVAARAAGAAWTRDGDVEIEAAWGLGPAVLSGQVVPDRASVDRGGGVRIAAGWKPVEAAAEGGNLVWRRAAGDRARTPSLDERQAVAIAELARAAARVIHGDAEIEWALGDAAIIVQVRARDAAGLGLADVPDGALRGIPAAPGEAEGRVRVVRGSDDLARLEPDEVLVAPFVPAADALSLRGVAIVTEMGGSSSHVAAIARERGLPLVCGIVGATRTLRGGERVRVDGTRGVVIRRG